MHLNIQSFLQFIYNDNWKESTTAAENNSNCKQFLENNFITRNVKANIFLLLKQIKTINKYKQTFYWTEHY